MVWFLHTHWEEQMDRLKILVQKKEYVYPAVAKLVPTVAEELEFFVRAAVTCCGAASSVRATTSLASN